MYRNDHCNISQKFYMAKTSGPALRQGQSLFTPSCVATRSACTQRGRKNLAHNAEQSLNIQHS